MGTDKNMKSKTVNRADRNHKGNVSKRQPKMLMKQWLINQIETRSCPGLEWYNEEQKMIRISWTHGSTHSWNVEKHAEVFRAWAIHSERYDPNKCNPKKWKANFRCALNSLPDVFEVPELHRKGRDAYKVYRIDNSGVTKRKKKNQVAKQAAETQVQTSADLRSESCAMSYLSEQSSCSTQLENESIPSVDEQQTASLSISRIYQDVPSVGEFQSISEMQTMKTSDKTTSDEKNSFIPHIPIPAQSNDLTFTEDQYLQVVREIIANPELVMKLYQPNAKIPFGVERV